MKKVYLETFGCQMNVSDSERVATSLAAKGFEVTTNENSADVILLNTCSVREKAEQKLYTRVGRVRQAHKVKPAIGVMGCVAQLEGETLFNKIEGLDFVIGTRAVGRVAGAIEKVLDGETGVADLGDLLLQFAHRCDVDLTPNGKDAIRAIAGRGYVEKEAHGKMILSSHR